MLRRRRSLEAAAGRRRRERSPPPPPCACSACRCARSKARSSRSSPSASARTGSRTLRLRCEPTCPTGCGSGLRRTTARLRRSASPKACSTPAPLDLRVNLARTSRDEVRSRLADDGIDAQPTPYSPAGLRVAGKPAINRHALFRDGLVEVQDEGSQLLAWLLAPRRGEMVADYCAGAGGKTLALGDAHARNGAHLCHGRVGPAASRACAARRARRDHQRASAWRSPASTIRASSASPESSIACSSTRRAAASARCGAIRTSSGATGRRRIVELAQKQRAILAAAARLVKPGGRLVYATCSFLRGGERSGGGRLRHGPPASSGPCRATSSWRRSASH